MAPTRSVLLLALFVVACGGDATTSGRGGPQPREGDPALEHTWTMPPQSGVLASGDLGSTPPQLAAALMENGRMPSIAHRIASGCAESGALAGAEEVALRFTVAEGGDPAAVQPDPAGAAGTCLARALDAQLRETGELAARAALLRVRLRPAG